MEYDKTIAALATPHGTGAMAIIRLSGRDALKIAAKVWKGADLARAKTHTAHLGFVFDPSSGHYIDQVIATVFRAPASFTGLDTVEFTCHGSPYIQQRILTLLTEHGAEPALPGEFSQMAFLNGKMDLAQAEGIADLISSRSEAAHRLALSQTRGTYSKAIENLRANLIEFASLIELELDFSEEDVEFADRSNLLNLAEDALAKINDLADSYSAGKVIKEGIPTVIAGIPNAGKSTLLNALSHDDLAIVSDIEGTTRDTIQSLINIKGNIFRLIDTAGLRATSDPIETIGVNRAKNAISEATIILILIDPTASLKTQLETLSNISHKDATIVPLITKTDLIDENLLCNIKKSLPYSDPIEISVPKDKGIDDLEQHLSNIASTLYTSQSQIIITNARHYHALLKASATLNRIVTSLGHPANPDIMPATPELIAQDIREVISHLGEITGTITSPTLLHHIFSSFCIGK